MMLTRYLYTFVNYEISTSMSHLKVDTSVVEETDVESQGLIGDFNQVIILDFQSYFHI